MKRLLILLQLAFCTTGLSSVIAQEKQEIFVDRIKFKLERVSENPLENEYFMTIKMNKGTSYKFRVTNNQENMPGKAVFEVLDQNASVITNVLNDKYFENINFVCNKTGFYDILIKYQEANRDIQ
jgi:hypothetical protein